MIIETSANQFYKVDEHDDPALSHVWCGMAVKKVRGIWVKKANAYGAYRFAARPVYASVQS